MGAAGEREQAVAELADLVGAPVGVPARPHVQVATEDAIANFARSYGDDNPLFGDRRYAGASVRVGIVAPPLFPIATGVPAVLDGDEAAAAAAGHLAVLGRGAIEVTAEAWWLEEAIRPGLRLEREDRVAAVRPEGPGAATVTIRSTYTAGGTCYAVHDRDRRYTPAAAGAPTVDRPLARYTDAELDAIEADYDAEVVRGSRTRFADDVAGGESLDPVVKGPLTVTDLVNYRSGAGPGPLGAESLRLGLANRRRNPGLYDRNPHHAFDNLERRHWDEGYARSLGYPSAYDYSHTRPVWITHLLTNWIGDGGWVAHLRTHLVGYNFLGDTHWVRGEVTDVELDADHGRVGIDVRTVNQRDEVTCHGRAVVLLPRPPRRITTPQGGPR